MTAREMARDILRRVASGWSEDEIEIIAAATEQDRAEREADTARLDWLDSVNKRMNERNGSRYGWRYEINHLRAALTDHNWPPLTIREAIDAARLPSPPSEETSS